MFTNAITMNVETKKNAIYYSNRALCHFNMENIGLVIEGINSIILLNIQYFPISFMEFSQLIYFNHIY